MKLPFRRKKPLRARAAQALAKFAARARLAIRRRSLRRSVPQSGSGKAA